MTTHSTFSLPVPKKEDFAFAELVQGREKEFPTLARAAQNSRPANDVRIEWTLNKFDGGKIGWGIWHNYQQIFRYPYCGPVRQGSDSQGGHTSPDTARTEFLHSVEQVLIHGQPFRALEGTGMPYTCCGGYRHFLGRDLSPADTLSLRPLREPFLWTHEWDYELGVPLETPKYEWLAEVSLQVVPGGA